MDNIELEEKKSVAVEKEKKKIPWGWIYIIATVVAMILFGVFNRSLLTSFQTILTLSLRYIWLALLFLFGYILLEGIIIKIMMKGQGIELSAPNSIKLGIIGLYYSAITPSATGGQPAQSAYLYRDNVSVGSSTAVLLMKFFCYQVAFEACALFSVFYVYDEIEAKTPYMIPLIIFGLVINGLSCVFFPMLFYKPFLNAICRFAKWLVRKIKFLRKTKLSDSIDKFQADFSSYSNQFSKKLKSVAVGILLSFPEFILQMSVIFFIFRAFGNTSLSYLEVFSIQVILHASVSFMPMPGASGAQELAFSSLFKPYFAGNDLFSAVMVWRLINYYLLVIGGGILVVIDTALYKRKKAKIETASF